jgi:hypothetical protein
VLLEYLLDVSLDVLGLEAEYRPKQAGMHRQRAIGWRRFQGDLPARPRFQMQKYRPAEKKAVQAAPLR